MRRSKFPVLPIHVKKEECAVHLQIIPLIPVDVPLVGKVHAAARM